MGKKLISKTSLMALAILLIVTCWQTSARSGEIKQFKGWVLVDTNDLPPRNWADLPDGAEAVLVRHILSDENSALLPAGDGPSGLPSELQWAGGVGNNNVGANVKNDIFSLAYFHFPTLTLYLWEYEVWISDNSDKLFTINKIVLNTTNMTLTGTKTVVGGTGQFDGAVSSPIKTFGGEANGTAALTYDGWIYINSSNDNSDAN